MIRGNLALKRRSTFTDDEIPTAIVEAYRLGSHPQFQCELRIGHKPQWYALRTIPGQERIAAAHLVGRRFPIYLPERRIEGKTRTTEPLFIGYIFVMVWDIGFHHERMRACPGVMGIVKNADGDFAVFGQTEMERIYELENEFNPLITAENVSRKRRWRRVRREMESIELASDYDVISVSCRDALRDGLDSGERKNVLRRALGLA